MFNKKLDNFTVLCNECKMSVYITVERSILYSQSTYHYGDIAGDDYEIIFHCWDCNIKESFKASDLDF